MKFQSTQISGKKLGRKIGFPTINLKIPADFFLEDGIYGVRVSINGRIYPGAMHYGPIPTFNENQKKIEIHLINVKAVPSFELIEVKVVKKIRGIRNFPTVRELKKQIEKDIDKLKKIKII